VKQLGGTGKPNRGGLIAGALVCGLQVDERLQTVLQNVPPPADLPWEQEHRAHLDKPRQWQQQQQQQQHKH
jgi:hypothetical protein